MSLNESQNMLNFETEENNLLCHCICYIIQKCLVA